MLFQFMMRLYAAFLGAVIVVSFQESIEEDPLSGFNTHLDVENMIARPPRTIA